MAIRVSVFAGLGSPALFSTSTQATALADASTPEAQALLNACHKIFLSEFSAKYRKYDARLGIDVEDFRYPQNLLEPPPRYHKNAIIQNTTLCLVQMLRYIGYMLNNPQGDEYAISGAAGVCSGLLVTMAVAACKDVVTFLSYSQRSFHLALLIGLHVEEHVKQVMKSTGCDRSFPWSIIVDGITMDQAENIISEHKQKFPGTHIYVSARSTAKCLTLSGRGDELREFSHSSLPKNCRVRQTNIFSPYHDAKALVSVRARVLADAVERKLSFPSLAELKIPMYLGEPVSSMNPATMQQSMLDLILDRILTRPVDWLSAQDQIFSDPAMAKDDGSLIREVLNFGPGYGVLKSEAQRRPNVQVLDVSVGKKPSIPPPGASAGDIAIVGMSVDLPGAPDTASLWKVLRDEINVVSEIPKSRFHIDDFYTSSKDKIGHPQRSLGTRFGNFMDNPFRFDNSFFGISPREAKSIDPQQRVLLHTTYKALEDAGYVPDATPSFARDTFGCYIGNATLDYPDNLKDDIDVYYSPGTLRAFMSGRISYVFGFSGPSMTVDTACSSSMVSIFHACRALNSGDCRAAVAGGINVITSPDMYLGLDRAHFLSPTGQCKAFDASADGYCRSEGCGVFVLKRLDDAIHENDNILGIIKGIEINQSGNADSITHPHAPTQTQLFEKLFGKADIDPLRVSVVEAHGTGTQAGDPQETKSIRRVLCKDRDESNPLYLTSIKANIGHCEAASGAAALAKLLLMTQKASIPKQVSLKNLNPRIDPLGVDGTVIARDQTEWSTADGQPRISMLNNFGAAGSNGVLLLQEPTQDGGENTSTEIKQRRSLMFGFSAKSANSLSAYKKVLIDYLRENAEDDDLLNLCYTSTARRQVYNYRSSVYGSSVRQLIEKLEHTGYDEVKKGAVSSVVFVFSGQGSQYISMGKELFATSTVFRETVLDCETWLQDSGFPSCLRIINHEDGPAANSDDEDTLQAMQISIFVVEVALARMWCDWGVQPTMVAGHSIGQYAALVTAGVLGLIDALRIVAVRARLMIKKCPLGTTGMLAVNRNADDIQNYISNNPAFQDLSVACCNSPSDCVVGGPLAPLALLKDELKGKRQCKTALLSNPMAYHTEAMDAILPDLTKVASSVGWSTPRVPVICNVLGRVVGKDEGSFTADFPARHCRQTVLFDQGIKDALSGKLEGQITWIEVGPHPSIIPMVKSQAPGSHHSFVVSMRKSTNPWDTLSEAQSQLYRSNVPVDWPKTFVGTPSPKCTSLPSYQFDYTDFLVEYPREPIGNESGPQPASTGYEFLVRQLETSSSSNSQETRFETPIESLAQYITGHIVCGFALCPASVYHEIVFAAAEVLDRRDGASDQKGTSSHTNVLSKISYLNPLIYVEGSRRVITASVQCSSRNNDDTQSFDVSSYEPSNPKDITKHCQGIVKRQSRTSEESRFTMLHAQLQKPMSLLESMNSIEIFRTRAIYEKLFTRVVTYSEIYQAVQSISVSADGTEALAAVELPASEATTKASFAVNPIFMDVILHVAGFVANLAAAQDEAFICKAVKSARVIMHQSEVHKPFKIYCSNTNVSEGTIGNGYAINSSGQLLAVFKGMHFTRVKLRAVQASFRHLSGATHASSEAKGPAMTKTKDGSTHQPVEGLSLTKTDEMDPQSRPSPAIDIKTIIADVCGTGGISLSSESDLEGLGIDSLMILELGSRIQETINTTITSQELTACETVRDIETLVASKTTGTSQLGIDATPSNLPSHKTHESSPVRSVRSIIVEICGIDANTITAKTELESLGIDSLMMFELEDKLKELSSASLDGSTLASCKTVEDVETLVGQDKRSNNAHPPQRDGGSLRPVLEQRGSSSSGSSKVMSDSTSRLSSPQLSTPPTRASSTSPLPESAPSMLPPIGLAKLSSLEDPLSLIQSGGHGGTTQPLILIHDGSGVSMPYRSIANLDRPLWGMSNPKTFGTDTWTDLDAMAQAYAAKVSANVKAPVILGGWSFGGVVAFRTAHILTQQGYAVTGVLLIDSPAPVNHQPLPTAIIDAVLPEPHPRNTTAAAIRRQFELNTALLANFNPPKVDHGQHLDLTLLRCSEGYDATGLNCAKHEWLEDRSDARTAVEGWEEVVGGDVRVIDVPGNHFEVFEKANVASISAAIKEGCRHFEKKRAGKA